MVKKKSKPLHEKLANLIAFYSKKKTLINYSFLFIVAASIAIYVYIEQYKLPRIEEAAQAMYVSENYFFERDWYKAVNGDKNNAGLLNIIEDYADTPSANIAHYYLGIAYLKIGEYQNAINYLSAFNTDDIILSVIAEGAIGDAYIELEDYENAGLHYQKAIDKAGDDNVYAAIYLYKQALLYEHKGQVEEAITTYQVLKEKYPQSTQSFYSEANIYRLKSKKDV